MVPKTSFSAARLAMAAAAGMTAIAVMVPLPKSGREIAASGFTRPVADSVSGKSPTVERGGGPQHNDPADVRAPTVADPLPFEGGDGMSVARRRREPTPLEAPTPVTADSRPGPRPERVASRGDAPALTDFPRPAPGTNPTSTDQLPPEPHDPEALPVQKQSSRTAAPQVELGPIDDAGSRSVESFSRKLHDALTVRSLGEPWINMHLVVQADPRAPVADAATDRAARLEDRLARVEDRLADLARRDDDQRAGRLEQTARRVESLQQSLQLQQLEKQVQQLKDRVKARGLRLQPSTANAPASADSPDPARLAASTTPGETTGMRPTASAAIPHRIAQSIPDGMPQIMPGPPYYRRASPGYPPPQAPAAITAHRPVPVLPSSETALDPPVAIGARAPAAPMEVVAMDSADAPPSDSQRDGAANPTTSTDEPSADPGAPSIQPLRPDASPEAVIRRADPHEGESATPTPPPPIESSGATIDSDGEWTDAIVRRPSPATPAAAALARSTPPARLPVADGFTLRLPDDPEPAPSAATAYDTMHTRMRVTPQAAAPRSPTSSGAGASRPGNLLAALKSWRKGPVEAAAPRPVPTPALRPTPVTEAASATGVVPLDRN